MDHQNFQNLSSDLSAVLESELFGATGYLEKLTHALYQSSEIHELEQVSIITEDFICDTEEFLKENILTPEWSQSLDQKREDRNFSSITKFIEVTKGLICSLIRLKLDPLRTLEMTTQYINLVYEYSYHLHELITLTSDMDIPYPRINLIEIKSSGPDFYFDYDNFEPFQNDQKEPHLPPLPLFYLNPEKVKQAVSETGYSPISDLTRRGETINSIETQRQKKHDQLITLGHQSIFQKKYYQAQELFEKALALKETPEALTLLGWVFSLIGQIDKAKSSCLKAIKKNPNYGPPYNDLGSYLLNEGEVEESLRWFQLAKKCSEYQSREYPYINAGRAYMAKKEYKKALDEFHQALALAPYHHQLKETINKLKKSLSASQVRKKFHESMHQKHESNDQHLT